MSCPNCGKEIVDEDAIFCPRCGEPLDSEYKMQENLTDLVLGAALLTIISAAFSSGIAYISIYQYVSLLSYYGHSLLEGFLILGVFAIVASTFGLAGGVFMLKRKRIKVSMSGVIFLLASVFVSYITIQHYQYGFTDILLFSELSIFILSILSGVLVFTSKTKFA